MKNIAQKISECYSAMDEILVAMNTIYLKDYSNMKTYVNIMESISNVGKTLVQLEQDILNKEQNSKEE